MCGRITQISVRQYYAERLSPHELDYQEWAGGDTIPQYNCGPGGVIHFLHTFKGYLDWGSLRRGYRTPHEAKERTKPWINARVEKALTGRYFRHMFKSGRIIVPSEGWYEWTAEGGKKQPWFITRKDDEPMFIAALTNWKPPERFAETQTVETGVVIVTQDSAGGMADVHDRRPAVFNTADAWCWIDQETPVEEAAHIAQTKSLPTDEFMWWRVERTVNRVDPYNNGKHLLTPLGGEEGFRVNEGYENFVPDFRQ